MTGFYQAQGNASDDFDRLRFAGLEPARRYRVTTRKQPLFIKRFGGLVKHILPFTLAPEGFLLRTADRHYAMTDCVEAYQGTGEALMDGILLNNQFIGTGYNAQTRFLGDFGSNLYVTEALRTDPAAAVADQI